MTQTFSSKEDDLHELMALAIVAARHGVDIDLLNIYLAWESYYPHDALGAVGRGLKLVVDGKSDEGLEVIASAAKTARTRADQAQDVLQSLLKDLSGMEEHV